MIPYWLLLAVFAVGAFNYRPSPGEKSRLSPVFHFAVVCIVTMIGLRFEVGGDWFNYMLIFHDTARMSLSDLLEAGDPGYGVLNGLAHYLGFGIWFVNLGCAIIFTWGLVEFAKRQPNPWLAVAVAIPYLIIVIVMGYARQGVAIGLIMASISRFEAQRYVAFGLLILAAAAFHKSAIIVIPMIALSTSRHRVLVYGGGAMIGAVLFFAFLDRFMSYIFTGYIETEMSSSGTAVRVVMNVLPAAIFLLFQRRFCRTEQERLIWRNFSIAAMLTVPALVIIASSTIVDRVALYLIPLQIFVLARLPYAFPTKNRANTQILLGVVLYSCLIQYAWLQFADNAESWLPYRFLPLEAVQA